MLLYLGIFRKACGFKNCQILKDKSGKVEATYFTVMCPAHLLAKTVSVNIAVYSGIIQSTRTVHFQV